MRMRILADTTSARLLAAIHAECFAEVWSTEWIAALLAQPGSFACLAEDASGFIIIRTAGDEAEVLTLAVKPAARRRGIASALVAEGAKQAQKQGASAMFLEVSCTNLPAIALYKRLGFKEVGRRKAYYAAAGSTPEDALVLRVEIPLPRVGMSLQLG
jgi:[ribosomal protein S18]-alanine N-acetyltransferase